MPTRSQSWSPGGPRGPGPGPTAEPAESSPPPGSDSEDNRARPTPAEAAAASRPDSGRLCSKQPHRCQARRSGGNFPRSKTFGGRGHRQIEYQSHKQLGMTRDPAHPGPAVGGKSMATEGQLCKFNRPTPGRAGRSCRTTRYARPSGQKGGQVRVPLGASDHGDQIPTRSWSRLPGLGGP